MRWEKKNSRAKMEERRTIQERLRILDVCPAIVMLPNLLLDLGVVRAAETTVGGSERLRSISTKGKEISTAVMKRQVIFFIWILLDYSQSDAFYTTHCLTL